ncbi:hypothetical protein CPAV1605_116 [seawater metagenome]|uniref:Glutamine amidotransferase domain-containing protein n=1 Tax=seawater metagenome TaxID=1561972 RepID=A0A5E8CI92_9ZZZZ
MKRNTIITIAFIALLLLIIFIHNFYHNFKNKKCNNNSFTKEVIDKVNPIIAIISAPLGGTRKTDSSMRNDKLFKARSYLPLSYVNWLQLAGAKVIVIDCFDNKENIENKLNYVNGCLFTGGEIDTVNDKDLKDYISTWKYVYNFSKSNNCPLWATCLGFEFLALMEQNEIEIFNIFRKGGILTNVKGNRISSKLIPYESFNETFKLDCSLLKQATENESLYYNHSFGYILDVATKNAFEQDKFDILSYNYDRDNVKYIGTIKKHGKEIYGTQWHPEKVIFEWKIEETLHNSISIRLAQEISNFFIKKCNNYKPKKEFSTEQKKWLIYNYDLYSYSKIKTVFEQQKYFEMLEENFDQFYLIIDYN